MKLLEKILAADVADSKSKQLFLEAFEKAWANNFFDQEAQYAMMEREGRLEGRSKEEWMALYKDGMLKDWLHRLATKPKGNWIEAIEAYPNGTPEQMSLLREYLANNANKIAREVFHKRHGIKITKQREAMDLFKDKVGASLLNLIIADAVEAAPKKKTNLTPEEQGAYKQEVKGPGNKVDILWPKDLKVGDICLVMPKERMKKQKPLLWKALYGEGGSDAKKVEQYLIQIIYIDPKHKLASGAQDFYYVGLDESKNMVMDYGDRPYYGSCSMLIGDLLKVVGNEPLEKHQYQGYTWYTTGNDWLDIEKMPNLDGRHDLFEKYAPKAIKDIYARQENINFHSENAEMVNDFCEWVAGGKKPQDFMYSEVGEDNGAANAGLNSMAGLKDLMEIEKTLKQAEATGEPDGDYDTEMFDAIANELKKHGYQASHKEFDKYQGPYLTVSKGGTPIAKFWIKDLFMTGKSKPNAAKYRKAALIDADGSESSANAGDYFMMQPNEVFDGSILMLTLMNGETKEIENPKKSDLPDLNDVSNSVEFEGKPDTVVIFNDEGVEDSEVQVIVSHDLKHVEIGDMLEHLKGLAALNASAKSSTTSAKKKDEDKQAQADADPALSARPPDKKMESRTWKESLDLAREIYPDAEKMLTKMGDEADADAILQVNNEMSEGHIDDDKKIGGVDVGLPTYMKDESIYEGLLFGPEPAAGMHSAWQDNLSITALRALAEIYPSVKDWMKDADNAYLSYGQTSGMMPYHHAKYPKDAVIFCIEGIDTEEELQKDVAELAAEYGKSKDLDTWKKFLKLVSDESLGVVYRYNGEDKEVFLYSRVQYNYALYFKLAEALKVVNKAQRSNKEETIDQKEVKRLIEDLKEGAGEPK